MKKYFLGLLLVAAFFSCKKDKKTEEIVDKIRIALSTSVPAYDAAGANSWVRVTAAEYDNLVVILKGAAKYAAPEIYMSSMPANGWTGNCTVAGNDNMIKVPASNYIVAWSVRTGSSVTNTQNSKLKISASQKSGYTDYGSALPAIAGIAAKTRIYFVLKTPSAATPATPVYTGVYSGSTYFLGSTATGTSGPEFFIIGDSPNPTTSYPSDSYYQVISTATKQW